MLIIETSIDPARRGNHQLTDHGRFHARFKKVIDSIRNTDLISAGTLLNDLANDVGPDGPPHHFLAHTAEALLTGNWSFFASAFAELRFLGPDGDFFLCAPYRIRREGCIFTELSALYGAIIPHTPLPDVEALIRSTIGDLRQNPPKVLPMRVHDSAGLLSAERGEAFVVPDGWIDVQDGNGPALNNMYEQRRRFTRAGRRCIRAIFNRSSADFLLEPFREKQAAFQLQYEEYQMHDFGHAAGIGLNYKLRHEDILATPSLRGVEEWRADGVAFDLADRVLPRDRAAQLIASNLVTRLGLDAHRLGGLDLDADAMASLMTFHYLIETDTFKPDHSGRLTLRDISYEGLRRAVEPMRAAAIRLTREELASRDPRAIWRHYRLDRSPSTEMLFEEHILQPCRGFYSELR